MHGGWVLVVVFVGEGENQCTRLEVMGNYVVCLKHSRPGWKSTNITTNNYNEALILHWQYGLSQHMILLYVCLWTENGFIEVKCVLKEILGLLYSLLQQINNFEDAIHG